MACGCNGNGNGSIVGSPTTPPSSQWLPSTTLTAPNHPQPLGGTPISTFRTSAPLTIGSTGITDRGLTWLAIIIAFAGLFLSGRRS